MKKTTFVSLLALCAGTLIICSYAGGAASHNIEGTGAETGLGNSAGCGQGCHTSATTTTISIELDSAGIATTRYVGGMTYTVKLTGKNTSTTSLPKFGFQIGSIVGSAASTTPTNAGTWNAPFPTNTKYMAPVAGKFVVGIVEQTAALAATTGTGGNGTTYVKTFNWTAPAAGTGTISFWAALNAVNGNNNDTGDKYNTGHVSITELVPSSPLNVTTSTVNVKCKGDKTGTATATATGGAPPYSYSWNSTPVQTTATATGLGAGSYTITVKDSKNVTATSIATITEPSIITITTSPTNASSCTAKDGSITSTVSGGTPPYTYMWSNNQTTSSITGLSASTYSLTVTDANSCKQTASAVVSCGSTALTVTTNVSNLKCFGVNDGSATAIASGGTPPYTYSWSTSPVQTTASVTGLSPGTYTVTVTDANTTKNATVIISGPTAISSTLTATNVSTCAGNDGSITSTTSGGTPPYTYSWSNGSVSQDVSGLSMGTYTLMVTDANGCKKESVASVIFSGAIPIGLSTPLTEGFEANTDLPTGWTLDNPEGDAAWQVVSNVSHSGTNSIGFDNCDGNGAGADMTGTKDRFITTAYDFTKTTATASLSFDLAYAVLNYKNKTLSDSLAIYSSTDCGTTWNLLFLKGGTDLSNIITQESCWMPTANDWRTETINLGSLAGKQNVMFAFENRSNWGEWIYIDNINITAITGIEKINPLTSFTIYPNPASTEFTISGTGATDKIHYYLYNSIGMELKAGEIGTNGGFFNEKIRIDDLPQGMYFIKLNDKKFSWTKKLNLQ